MKFEEPESGGSPVSTNATQVSGHRLTKPWGPAAIVAGEHITGPEQIAKLLQELVRERAPAWLRHPTQGRVPVSTLSVDERGLIVASAADILPSPLTLEWLGHNSLFRGAALPRVERGGMLVVPAPEQLERVQNRAFRRILLSGQLVVRWRSVRDGQVGLLALRDVSVEGLSAWCPHNPDAALAVGHVFVLSVISGKGPSIDLQADLRSFGEPLAGGEQFAGFSVRPMGAADGSAWLDLVERYLHPRVRTDGADLEDVWSLYTDAGYLTLSGKRPSDFFDIKASFVGATSRALKSPAIALQAVWPAEGSPEATLSAVRLYEHAWLGFHMAKASGPAADGTPGRTVLREIHESIYERIQRDPGARWIIGHTQVRPVWSRLCHHDIAARYVDSGDAAIWRFRAIEVRTLPSTPASTQTPEVGIANAEETAVVLAALGRQLPEPMLEALDLVPRRFDIQGVRRRWWTAGLQRDRGLLVARRGNQLVAALLTELSDEGLHVFRLLDHAIPVALAPGGRSYFPRLLAAAHDWYFARGRETWAYFGHAGNELDLGPGMVDLGEADMCILSTDCMPEFFEHLHRITVNPREQHPLA